MQKIFLEIDTIWEILSADMGSVLIFNMHAHFSLVTETAGRNQLFLPSLAVAVPLPPTTAARELAMAHVTVSRVHRFKKKKKKKQNRYYIMELCY